MAYSIAIKVILERKVFSSCIKKDERLYSSNGAY